MILTYDFYYNYNYWFDLEIGTKTHHSTVWCSIGVLRTSEHTISQTTEINITNALVCVCMYLKLMQMLFSKMSVNIPTTDITWHLR